MTSILPIDGALCVRLMMTLVHFLWQGAGIALAVLVAGWVLRGRAANSRYVVFLGALLIMAACPPVTFVLLGGGAHVQGVEAGRAERPAVRLGVAARAEPPAAAERSARGAIEAGQGTVAEGGVVVVRAMPEAAGLQIQAVLQPVDPPVKAEAPRGWRAVPLDVERWQRYAPYVVVGYGAGVVLTLARLVLGLYGGGRLRRRSEPVADASLLAALGRQARVLGLHVTPAIAFCGRVAVPTVVGVLRPTILLPLAIVSGMTIEQVETLLAHELAHIRRHDHIINILQRLIEAFLFFHPGMWFVSRRIRAERELCCDDWVVRAGSTPLAYADSLVRAAELCTARLSNPVASAALAATDRSSQLRIRVLRLLGVVSDEPVRLAHAWPGVMVLAVVGVLVTCHQLGAATSSKFLEGDAALLKQVAAAHKANRELIRTWKASVTIENKTWSAADENAEPKTVSTDGGEFVLDQVHDRLRWNEQGKEAWCMLLNGPDAYRMQGGSSNFRQVAAMFRGRAMMGAEMLDPISVLQRPDGEDIEAGLLMAHKMATDPDSIREKMPAERTGTVQREGEQVVLTFSAAHMTSKSVFDLGKGGNLVSHEQDGPKQSQSVRLTYEPRGGAWVPTTCEWTDVDRVEGVATTARGRRMTFSRQAINEAVAASEFDVAKLGLRTDDWVSDWRAGDPTFDLRYGEPFGKPREGSTIASWVARRQGAAPAETSAAWRTMVSGGGFVELLGIGRPVKQDSYTYPEWWMPDGTLVESNIRGSCENPGDVMAALRITAPAEALRGWAIAGGNRVPLRVAHHVALTDIWVVVFDMAADAEQVQFELELGTNPKEVFRQTLSRDQLEGKTPIRENGLDKIASFKAGGRMGAQMEVQHKAKLAGDRFAVLMDGRVLPVASQVVEAGKADRQVTRMVLPVRDVEGLVRQQFQWRAVTIRSAASKPTVLKPEEAAERDREKAALAEMGQEDVPAPASEPSNEPPGEPNLFFEKFPMEQAEYFSIQGSGALTVVDPKPAFCQSDQPLEHYTPKGTFVVRMLFDESGGTGSGYDTMYVDFNNNGDYLDDPVYHAESAESSKGPDHGTVVSYFSNVRVKRSGTQGWWSPLQVFLEKYGGDTPVSLKCCFIPQNWAVGNVKVGGQTLRAALVDGNWNGTVTDLGGLALDRFPNMNAGNPVRADNLALGLDGEDHIIPGNVGSSMGTVRVFLTKYLVLDSGTYQIRAQPSGDGVRLDLAAAQVPMGQVPLDEKVRASRLSLVGKQTAVVLSNPGAVVELPADTYYGVAFEQSLHKVHAGDVAEVPAAPVAGPSGVVLKPSGEPASKARVMVAGTDNYLYISNGQPSGWGRSVAATTDAEGKFSLTSGLADYTLVVVHDAGWAEVPKEQFGAGGRIVLQAWARVEGVLRRGSKPWAGEDVSAYFGGVSANAKRMSYGYQATTDRNGRFVFERFIPTKATVGHDACSAEVDAKPGQTVQVNLGVTGRSVTGRISGPGGQRLSRTGIADQGRLFTPDRVPEPPHPDGWDKMTAAQRQAYVQSWLKSPAGQKALQAVSEKPRGAWFMVRPDGAFRVENVEPGTYNLDVPVRARGADGKVVNELVATAHALVEIPEGAVDVPVNLGLIEAEVKSTTPPPTASQPAASQPATASQPTTSRPAGEEASASG